MFHKKHIKCVQCCRVKLNRVLITDTLKREAQKKRSIVASRKAEMVRAKESEASNVYNVTGHSLETASHYLYA